MCKKRLVVVFVLSMMVLSLSGCHIRTPVRVAERPYNDGCYTYEFLDFTKLYEKADIVARVKIGNWLGEQIDRYITLFEAEVVEQYKGEPLDDFVLLQDGTSEITFKGYPLFTYGDELLIFLQTYASYSLIKGPESYQPDQIYILSTGYQKKKGDCYYIYQGEKGSYDIIRDSAGNAYIADRYHLAEEFRLTDYSSFPEIRRELNADLSSKMEKEVRDVKYSPGLYEDTYLLEEIMKSLQQ